MAELQNQYTTASAPERHPPALVWNSGPPRQRHSRARSRRRRSPGRAPGCRGVRTRKPRPPPASRIRAAPTSGVPPRGAGTGEVSAARADLAREGAAP